MQIARAVVTDSHWQARKIRELWPEMGEKVRVVHPVISPVYRTPPSESTPRTLASKPYFLMVGVLEPRKRVELAIDAWKESSTEVDLRLVGRWGWKASGIRRRLNGIGSPIGATASEKVWRLADGRSLHHHLSVPSGSLVDLYRHSRALVYPSIFEGFGLPVLEAMTVGCPVITRKDSAMEEIAGPAGWYFQSDSIEELSTLMETILRKEDMRRGRATLGRELAKNFSDENFYEGIATAYEAAFE